MTSSALGNMLAFGTQSKEDLILPKQSAKALTEEATFRQGLKEVGVKSRGVKLQEERGRLLSARACGRLG